MIQTCVTRSNCGAQHKYDVDGARSVRFANGERLNFLVDRNWENAQVLRAIDVSGHEVARHIFGREEVLSSLRAVEGRLYMLYDGQRSVRSLADSSGTVSESHLFDAWGVEIGGLSSNSYGYSGEDFDAGTGLIYLRARFYDPILGRFHSIDPARHSSLDPQQAYLYAQDDPVQRRDPSGRIDVGVGGVVLNSLVSIRIPALRPLFHTNNITSATNMVVVADAAAAAAYVVHQMASGYWTDHFTDAFDANGNYPAGRVRVGETWQKMAQFVQNGLNLEQASYGDSVCLSGRGSQRVAATEGETISLCPKFFTQSGVAELGSRKLSLVHEISHLAGAEDVNTCSRRVSINIGGVWLGSLSDPRCYGIQSCRFLAETQPNQSIQNADNYAFEAYLTDQFE